MPPFGLCWLDCGQNIYRGAIKVIHPYRKSQPFENGVNIKRSFYPSSFFTETEPRHVEIGLDLSIFCRYMRLLPHPMKNNHQTHLHKTSIKDSHTSVYLHVSSYPGVPMCWTGIVYLPFGSWC